MRWLIDLDGVVIDNMATQLALANARFSAAWTPADLRTWDTAASLGGEAADWLWGPDCFLDDAVQAAMEPVPGALEALRAFHRHADTLFFVTDRPHCLYPATRAWLDARQLHAPLIFARPRGKAAVALDLGVDYAVDDAPHNAFSLQRVVGRYCLLWNAPYNQTTSGRRLVRVHGWDDVVAMAEAERASRPGVRR
jgi:uncharacterized HAD superfamily protein